MISNWHFRTLERHIGIVGLANAGKSVLLTSLADHLANHEPDRFRLGKVAKPATIRKFKILPPTSDAQAFDYELARKQLGLDHRWPRKTKDRYEFHCTFRRSDWLFNDIELHLYDLPGERLADATMINRNHAEWSDRWFAYLNSDRSQSEIYRNFTKILEAGSDPETWIDAYKLALAQTLLEYKSFVVPSYFWLDSAGTLPRGATATELIAGRTAGLPGAEFTPMPSWLRERHTKLASTFEQNFQAYVNTVVEGYLRSIASCHALIVLVDVVSLLNASVGAANDYRQMLADLFAYVRPGEDTMARFGRHLLETLFQYRPRRVTKIAFVAPKIDLVHPRDRDRVAHLLQTFVGRHATDHDGLDCQFFSVASVVSTQTINDTKNERLLVGRRYRDEQGQRLAYAEPAKYPVSEVPKDWPLSWQPGDHSFPEVYPEVPPYLAIPPTQLGLDRLMNFLLD